MNNANGGNIIFHFKGDTSSLSKATNSLGGMTKSILVATGITKAFSMGMNLIASSTGSAIERLDQLNAFPNVMSSLGIETSKSEKAIKKLSEGLKGLPTTLNQGTSAVSRFVSKNGDVERSTEIFLALNDAIIAGNAPAENQASALEQITQAYAKGKPELNEWRSLMVAMPGQLKQVAQAMGYIDTDQLYEALKNGEVSMDDFMNKIIELDKVGGKGFESFNKQAKNAVGGIQTSITNMKTAVARGVANVISSIDKGLKEADVEGGISGIIGKIGEGFETGLNQVATEIQPLLTGILSGSISIPDAIQDLTEKLLNVVVTAINTIKQQLPNIVPKAADFLLGVSEGFEEMAPKIAVAVDKLFNIMVQEFSKPENQDKVAQAAANMVIGLINGIVAIAEREGVKGLYNIVKTISDMPFEIGKKIILDIVKGIAQSMGLPVQKIEKMGAELKNKIKNLPSNFYEIGKNIVQGLINGITSKFASLREKANVLGNIVSNIVALKNKIHSPSKLFEWYGEMIDLGYIKGIEGMKNEINKAVVDTFSISPQLANSSALNYSSNVIVNNQVINETDPLGQTVTNIKTFSNGAKNDYNYGMGG